MNLAVRREIPGRRRARPPNLGNCRLAPVTWSPRAPNGFYKKFGAATKERDIVVECKAMVYTETGNNPAAKISSMREACNDLRSIPGDVDSLDIPRTREGDRIGPPVALSSSRVGDGLQGLQEPRDAIWAADRGLCTDR
jgi:hypothetical protein